MITAEHIKLDYLKAIFEGETDKALRMIEEQRLTNTWELNYEHTLLISFWLAIQKEDLRVATYLMNFDPYLRYVATLAFKGKEEMKHPPKKRAENTTSPSTTPALSPNPISPPNPDI